MGANISDIYCSMCGGTTDDQKIERDIDKSQLIKPKKIKCCKSIDGGCEFTKNVIKACKHYLRSSSQIKNKDELINFCETKYQSSLLNDFIHILDEHNNETDLNKIMKLLFNHNLRNECDIINCQLSLRYHRNRRYDFQIKSNDKIQSMDYRFIFWQDIMDQIHLYLYHLYDIGMRLHKSKRHSNTINIDNRKDLKSKKWVDKSLQNICHSIDIQKKRLQKITGFEEQYTKDKFNLHNTSNTKLTDVTFMDGLYSFVEKHNNNDISSSDTHVIKNLIMDQKYESDAIEEDIDDQTNSNFAVCNANFFKLAKKYVYICKAHRNTYGVGWRFYYWSFYRNHLNSSKKASDSSHFAVWNVNDHDGYQIQDLFVNKKYKNIKHEILNNAKFSLTNSEYQLSVNKTAKFMDTDKAKNTKASPDCYGHQDRDTFLHYDIKAKTPISAKHILSIILYCDWSDLSTEFSKSFRSISAFETILYVKKRNAEFANWSRLLRETVEIFGINWNGEVKDKSIEQFRNIVLDPYWNIHHRLYGPFYCGMSYVMTMPKFIIRLNGPTSTSMQRSVAVRFAGRDGMLIQLLNNAYVGLSGFQCSWLSNYSAEDEVLFMGGVYPIKIQSVTIISTKQNFEPFYKALSYFDCMVSGHITDKQIVRNTDYVALDNLIKHKLKMDSNSYPKYINDTFKVYVDNKKQIIINLIHIDKYFGLLAGLIMNKSEIIEVDWRDPLNQTDTHLFKNIFFNLFENMNDIIIHTTDYNKETKYMVNVLPLLSLLQKCSQEKNKLKIIVTAYNKKTCGVNSWISEFYSIFLQRIKAFSQQISVRMDDTIDSKMDCLVIST